LQEEKKLALEKQQKKAAEVFGLVLDQPRILSEGEEEHGLQEETEEQIFVQQSQEEEEQEQEQETQEMKEEKEKKEKELKELGEIKEYL
jgi:hypothetical protein